MSGTTNDETKRRRKAAALPTGVRPAVLTEPEAAAYLGISPRTLFAINTTPGGPACVRIGTAKRYRLADLDAYLAKLAGEGA